MCLCLKPQVFHILVLASLWSAPHLIVLFNFVPNNSLLFILDLWRTIIFIVLINSFSTKSVAIVLYHFSINSSITCHMLSGFGWNWLLSRVTRRVVSFKKPLAKWPKKPYFFRALWMPTCCKCLSRDLVVGWNFCWSQVTCQLVGAKTSSNWSQVTHPDELIKIVQYSWTPLNTYFW